MHAIKLNTCAKGWTRDLDKAVSPASTIRTVRQRLQAVDLDICAGARRVDNGRLGIPVYLGICGQDAREIMPSRKQMGKGSSPDQALASALMELMERYAFFSFWANKPHMIRARWSEAEKLFGGDLIPISEILRSVNDSLDEARARRIMDLTSWLFYPATDLAREKTVWLPFDWFKLLGEFNGSSAGNTQEESLLQGICEILERHACAILDRDRPVMPTIEPASLLDPTLAGLAEAFRKNAIQLVLKDISGGLPLPVVAALAWDPATFPEKSEIVFTAGAATSPARAAIRAITEVAQLGGDFNSNSCYEASGLPKFTSLDECRWLLEGETTSLASLPSVEDPDMAVEIRRLLAALAPVRVYAVETTNPDLEICAHYCIAPGLEFRERDKNQSLGLFAGRKIAEEDEPQAAATALAELESILPNQFYAPFFKGILALRLHDTDKAANFFRQAAPLQPESEALAMCHFYQGYAQSRAGDWQAAIPCLKKAVDLCPRMKEYANLLGVALFRTGQYASAEDCFNRVLKIDKGSAIDLANRGLCREMLGRAAEAMTDFRAALELDAGIDFAAAHLAELEGR